MRFIHRSKNESGFTLIEMAVVVVIVGIVISIMATVLPSLIQSAKIRKARAILEKVDYSLEGYISASGQCPCPDTDGDGKEDRTPGSNPPVDDTCNAYVGNLPYLTLGLSSGEDNWHNPIKYAVYEDLIKTTSSTGSNYYCYKLRDIINYYRTNPADTNKLYTTDKAGNNPSNKAYVIVSGGAKDLDDDGVDGFFDGFNEGSDPHFDEPDRIEYHGDPVADRYDDLMRALSFNYLRGRECGGDGGGDGGGGGVENSYPNGCTNGIDDDGDLLIDCDDPDCFGHPACLAGGENVQIATTSVPSGNVNDENYSVTFTASGGITPYEWELLNNGGFTDFYLHPYTGRLSGTLSKCPGNYSIQVKVVDSTQPTATSDIESFNIEVTTNLEVARTSGSGTDIEWNSTSQEETFKANGGHLGDINWTLDTGGATGFVYGATGDTTYIKKNGATTPNTYTFTLTATDDACAGNTDNIVLTVVVTESGSGSPSTEGMEAEWRFDECDTWDGTSFDVVDSIGSDDKHYGKAVNGTMAVHAGKNCRAAYFDGGDDKIVSDVLAGGDIMTFNNEVTLACWFKSPGGGGSSPRLIEFSDSTGSSSWSTAICYNSDGSLRAWVSAESSGTRGGEIDYNSELYNDNEWHHVVYTYSDTNGGNLYVDNVLKKTATDDPTGDIHDAETFVIGGYYPNTSHGFNGLIDEVMVFRRELTVDDVAELYNLTRSSCTGDCYTEPVAEYRMENFPWNGTANEVKDSGTGVSHGVAAAHGTGGALPSQTTPSGGKVCRAGVFTRVDGSNGGYLDLGDPTDGDLDPYTDPWTISAWIKWDGSSGIIYNKESLYEAQVSGGYVNYAWQPHWAWDGGISFPVTADEWTYVTTVYDGSQQIFYKNGDMVYSRAQTGAMGNNSSKLLIGARGSASPNDFFGGMIDEVKIYNRALAENEIKADKDETRDCAADSVVITTSSLSAGTVNSSYSMTIEAEGGTEPYWWTLEKTLISGLSIDQTTGVLSGTINVCPGTYGDAVTIKVEDAAHRIDERKFDLTVNDGSISISPSPPGNFNCNTSDWSQEFTASGSYLGDINWSIEWVFSDPGGIGITNEQSNSMILDKTGVSPGGEGTYYFKLTATDSLCPTNTYTNTTPYSITISGDGVDAPYDYGLAAEWHMDECIWDGTSGEVADSSGNNNNGTAQNSAKTISMGKICRAGSTDATSSYVLLNPVVDLDDNSWTISAWFEWPLSSSGSGWWTLTRGTNDHQILVNRTSNLLGMYDTKTGTGFHSCGFDMSTLSNGWHHIVAVGYDSQTDYYIDGSLKGSADHKSDTDIKTIGNYIGGSQNWGKFDEVLVWSRALDADDVAKVYSLYHTCPSTSCYSGSIAAWLMDENSWDGTEGEVQDSAGSAHGTAQNGTTTTLDGTCYTGEFDGVDDYITIPADATALDVTGDITVALWFYPNNLDSNLMTNRYNFSGREHGYHLQTKADGTVLWSSHDATTNANAACIAHSTGTVTADQWNHITVVKADGSTTVRFYVNGVSAGMDTIQKASIGYSSSYQNRWNGAGYDSYTYGGGYTFGSRQYTDGKIDEVVIWDRGLSESEIKDIYNAGRCD